MVKWLLKLKQSIIRRSADPYIHLAELKREGCIYVVVTDPRFMIDSTAERFNEGLKAFGIKALHIRVPDVHNAIAIYETVELQRTGKKSPDYDRAGVVLP